MTSSGLSRARLARAMGVSILSLLPLTEPGLLRGATAAPSLRQAATAADTRIDAVFARWNQSTPGCSVGVASRDATVLHAYGMADLEHDVRNADDTIFEAGSVSKQFTAAAVLLLARNGKLSLDDSVRKYIPELPDYGTPLTIRHMLTHTSGLRDWGNVAAIGGWPRTRRVYTHAHVLDIVSRQRALNFTPGTRWSYSNTGYNLAAVIVSRVSGESFADFTRHQLFEPLGMTRTSWRDDFTRVVKGRAVAYAQAPDGYHQDMPFENVHGNGGLLTTAGDLLRWMRNFSAPRVGDAAFVKQEQTPGRFTDGREHEYGFGLFITRYKGVREVQHGGATAGYRAYVADYPDQHVSVAVLCNAGNANAAQYAHAVADLYLGDAIRGRQAEMVSRANRDATGASMSQPSEAELGSFVGMYRSADTGEPLTVSRADDGGLRLDLGGALRAIASSRFALANGASLEFDANRARMTDRFGTVETFDRVETTRPDAAALQAYVGSYFSDEAETTFVAAIDGDTLVLKRRPDTVIRLTPVYVDAFRAPNGLIRFYRNSSGRVTSLGVSQDRVWDLRFERQ
jgi:CubicO group peptidase (beta-lactamase class C family)